MHRRTTLRTVAALMAAGALAGLAGCGTLGLPDRIVITEAQLQERLVSDFPQQRRVLSLVDFTLQQPVLRLLPAQNRVAVQWPLQATERLTRKAAAGLLDADSMLRFDAGDMTLRLAQVRVASLQLADAGGPWPQPVQQAAAVVAEQLLEGQMVWRASTRQAERLRQAGVQQVDVRITEAGIELALGSTPR
ncbi:DUF1439 domain-containing protein [Aquincola sp. J276]|uniref:DUF1439 domain-containing protein n=1 Tax=Aquincola sp. J276 TaxID=2898432 RepID=UPI002150F453|nr:DUF1439 domain-containing protein [Aquincola sp. J276]MCR5865287.1 DUF1439 domain-containing protein [Aquincola sp. J276]